MELLFAMSEDGFATSQFYENRSLPLVLRTIVRSFLKTAKMLNTVDMKEPKIAALHYEYIYPQLVTVNEWLT